MTLDTTQLLRSHSFDMLQSFARHSSILVMFSPSVSMLLPFFFLAQKKKGSQESIFPAHSKKIPRTSSVLLFCGQSPIAPSPLAPRCHRRDRSSHRDCTATPTSCTCYAGSITRVPKKYMRYDHNARLLDWHQRTRTTRARACSPFSPTSAATGPTWKKS